MQQMITSSLADNKTQKEGEQTRLKLLETPDKYCRSKHKLLAQEYVTILNEKIEQKINWQHQLFLLTGSSLEQQLGQSQQIISLTDKEVEVKDFQQALENTSYLKICQQALSFLKTPQVIAKSPQNKCKKFSLQNAFMEQNRQKPKSCSCKKSNCLKMYCQCFRNGNQCINCSCCDCKNTQEFEDERKKAKDLIVQKQPTAFMESFKYKGCHCSKSKCQKNYCECFLNGLKCGKYCRCTECENGKCKKVNQRHKAQETQKPINGQ